MKDFANFPIVILCGGKSSRMQTDKSLLPFAGFDSLAQFQYQRLKKEFKNVFISSKNNKFDFPLEDQYIILDKSTNIFSPLIALKSILEKINAKVFILSVDTPFVQNQSIKKIIETSKNYEISTARTAEKGHNLCGVFSHSLMPKIKEMLKNDIHKINDLIQQSSHIYVDFQDEEEFLNLNTQDDYKQAIKILNKGK